MGEPVLVQSDGVQFYVELAETGDELQPVGFSGTYSFDDIQNTIKAIGKTVLRAWDAVNPSEASVEFSLKLTAKSGKLTGLLVDGQTEGSLAAAVVIKLGRVKEITTMRHGVTNQLIHLRLVARPPVFAAAKGPTADPEHRELEIMCSALT